MMRTRLLCCVMLLAFLPASSGQIRRPGQQPEEPQLSTEQAREMEKARQRERIKEMKRDTERLLELATELKQEVDRSGEHSLSVSAMKKAEQIEKLAHSVKTKMRGD